MARIRKPLTEDVVVDAAFAVLDAHGFDELTVRAIAKKLGVENPALYWHFENKQAIVDAMAARMIAAAVIEPKPKEAWDACLLRWARGFRAVMRAHREGARVVAAADLSQSAVGPATERALAFLVDAGFTAKDAAVGLLAISDYTLGATFEQQADPVRKAPPASFAQSSVMRALGGLDEDGVFNSGLALLVEGLRERLRYAKSIGRAAARATRSRHAHRAPRSR